MDHHRDPTTLRIEAQRQLTRRDGPKCRRKDSHADGMSAKRSRSLPRPSAATARFGSRVRAADVDGDHHLDLIEGGPALPLIPGHGSLCRGSSSGPRRCRAFGGTDATTGLAVADVNHDGYADIAQG